MSEKSLYERLGGYDGISGFASNLLPRLQGDAALGRFWANRGADGIAREKQLLIDYLCSVAGGPMVYTGRDMSVSHKGMKINESDWETFLGHAGAAIEELGVPKAEADDVVTFVLSIKDDIVDS
jgi:hemoglobin